MSFARPGILIGLIVLVGLGVLVFWSSFRAQILLSRWIKPEHWTRVVPEYYPQGRFLRRIAALVALGFALVALARPQWGENIEISKVSGLDIMVALDLSNSMSVEDVAPARLALAKHWLKRWLMQLQGDRVGLLGFGASAHVFVPLTQDLEYVQNQLQSVNPGMITHQGTDLGLALEVAGQTLDRGAENDAQVSAQKLPDDSKNPEGAREIPSRVILLITDGEDHEGSAVGVAKRLKEQGMTVFILGVGTERGGPVPILDENGVRTTFKKNSQGEPIISKFNAQTLENLASESGGEYWNLTVDQTLDAVLGRLGKLNRTEHGDKKVVTKKDQYQWPLVVAIVLWLLEMGIPLRRIARSQLGVRTVLIMFWLGSLTVGLVPSAEAGILGDWKAYWRNRSGVGAAQEGRADDAAKAFDQAREQSPDRPEPVFNQGVARAQKGDTEGAEQAFTESARLAVPGSAEQAAAYYNEAGVKAQKKDWLGAARSYQQAIEAAQKSRSIETEAKARKNLELLQRQQEEEQKKQDQNKKEQDQQKQDQKTQPQNGSQDNNQNGSDSESQNPNEAKNGEKNGASGVQHRRSQFKSQKLTAEDAERVLNELQSKEKELQGKIRKQGKKGSGMGQDW